MKNANEKVLIIFPDSHLNYSPTILHLIKCLKSDGFDITVLAFFNPRFGEAKTEAKIIYMNKVINEEILQRLRAKRIWISYYVKKYSKIKYKMIFAVDCLAYLVAKKVFQNVMFLSLEISDKFNIHKCKKIGIEALIIQNKERAKYLLGDSTSNVYYIANSGFFDESKLSDRKEKKNTLVYFGSIIDSFGIKRCIDVIRYLPEQYSLELHGIVSPKYKDELYEAYGDMFVNNRVIISDYYINEEDVTTWLSEYGVGICFYSKELVKNDYDFETCPSGKLFNYYCAGIPVIASDIVGLKSVCDYNAGKLFGEENSQIIAENVLEIYSNYEVYALNSRNAGKDYDFQKAYNRFMRDYKEVE